MRATVYCTITAKTETVGHDFERCIAKVKFFFASLRRCSFHGTCYGNLPPP